MKSAEQWSKELGTHSIHSQGADEVCPNVSPAMAMQIQTDALASAFDIAYKAGCTNAGCSGEVHGKRCPIGIGDAIVNLVQLMRVQH